MIMSNENVVKNYEEKINKCKSKEEIKEIVREMYKDDINIYDLDLVDIIEKSVLTKLKGLNIEIPSYNENTQESAYDIIIQEKY